MNKNNIFLSGKAFAFLSVACVMVIVAVAYNADNNASSDEDKVSPISEAAPISPDQNPVTETVMFLPGIEKKQEGFDFDNEMKLKLQNISDAYLEQAKYPSYSVPIDSEELSTKYLPDMPVATELPADLSNPESPTLSILPSKFRYFEGDSLSAVAQISGLDTNEMSQVSGQLIMHGKTIGTAVVLPVEGESHQYQLAFDAIDTDKVQWKENITIDVEFQLLGEIYTRSITVEYLNTIAQIEGVSASEVDQEYLLIPVYVATDKPGYHRLQANLYDAETDQALVHLTAEDQLLSSHGQLVLKAHISALKVSGSQGPYILKDMLLRRLPSDPEYITEFGRIEETAFEVDGYDFSEFEDKPYINEKAQRIANELRNLGS